MIYDKLLKNVIKNKDKFTHIPTSVVKKANEIAKKTDEMEEKSPFKIDDVISKPKSDKSKK